MTRQIENCIKSKESAKARKLNYIAQIKNYEKEIEACKAQILECDNTVEDCEIIVAELIKAMAREVK